MFNSSVKVNTDDRWLFVKVISQISVYMHVCLDPHNICSEDFGETKSVICIFLVHEGLEANSLNKLLRKANRLD